VSSAVSHPLLASPSQSPKPASQRRPHAPAVQNAVEFGPDAHAVVHAPQVVGSVFRSWHPPEQFVSPPPHEAWHVPIEQASPAPHAFPHEPQFIGSERKFASQPSIDDVLQLPKFALHTPMTHAFELHELAAFANAQVTPHAPQFIVVLSAVSQPLVPSVSQSAKPVSQRSPHVPVVQNAVEFGPDGHAVEHMPHAPGSLFTSRHEPLQLVRPVMHDALHTPLMHA
jgi:hypothetical protein